MLRTAYVHHVEDLAAVMFEGATSFTGLGQQRLQDAPFAVAHIARIWFAFAHAVQPLATTRPYPLYWTRSKKNTHNPLKGALVGLIAGGVAGAVMDGYWAIVKNLPGARPEQKPKSGDDNQKEEKPSTQIVADKVSEALTGEEVPKKDKPVAGIGVHYATSVGFGVPFGVFASLFSKLGLIAGALYGVAIWLFFDEIALRALKIAPKPEKVSTSEHLQALGAHLVYGSATGALTRLLLR